MRALTSLACLLLLASAGAASAQAIKLDTLSEDEVTLAEVPQASPLGRTYTAMTLMNASPHKLCAVVQDYGAYGRYMPGTRSAVVVPVPAEDAVPGQVLVDMAIELPLGKVKRYRLQFDAKTSASTCQLSWKLVPRADLKVEDTIGDTKGYWMFSAAPGKAGKSVVEYFIYADPGPLPFGLGWIVDMLSKRSPPKTVEALRGEARRRP
jgi:hypothetical protein